MGARGVILAYEVENITDSVITTSEPKSSDEWEYLLANCTMHTQIY